MDTNRTTERTVGTLFIAALAVHLGTHRRPVSAQLRVLGLLGYGTDLGSALMLLAMPIAFQELVFAGWLITRGVDRPTARPQPDIGTARDHAGLATGRRG